MSTLHLFNPSHDEALASNSPYYYPSTIARRLAVEWGALPCLWAVPADAVWVSEEHAGYCHGEGARLVTKKQLTPAFWQGIDHIAPWGWDPLVRHQLLKAGAPRHLLPTDAQLESVRHLSSRHTTALLLPKLVERLQSEGLPVTGQSVIAQRWQTVTDLLHTYGQVVVKSLWSCSGRGVFRMEGTPSASDEGRVKRLLREQDGVEVEPFYVCRYNFALEFDALPNGSVRYAGLSVFRASQAGAYGGNLIAPQPMLRRMLFSASTVLNDDRFHRLCSVCEQQLSAHIGANGYCGPLGVDMMLVSAPEGERLHPCVEVNVRRTMGYVAAHWPEGRVVPNELASIFQIVDAE